MKREVKMYEKNLLGEIPKSEIHLELYVDESKQREYNEALITYIMIMAIPTESKNSLYNQINNARCLSEEKNVFSNCKNNCKYHNGNNREIHYSEIRNDRVLLEIASRWIDILLKNNLYNEKNIFFNILGINETNLNFENFGNEKQYGNMYCRFFRTNILRLLRMFDKYDKIVIDRIYHDKTNEMEAHPYFKTNAIKNIQLRELMKEEAKISFSTNYIKFIDSNHNEGLPIESQFIQFVDVLLGSITNAIHNSATNINKRKLTEKIYPLVSEILNKNGKQCFNCFNKQCISFFPKYKKEELQVKYGELSSNVIDALLHSSENFENTKSLLFKIDDGQLSFFD